jgi:hypothetical protein
MALGQGDAMSRFHGVGMKKTLGVLALVLFSGLALAQRVLELVPDQPGALTCWTESRSAPRPLRIHYLKVALNNPTVEVFTLPGDDPDGAGPAESQLTQPIDLFRKFRALAAVNANAFSGLNAKPDDADWFEGRAVDMHGLVVSGGKVISPEEKGRTAFWIDGTGKPHIGTPRPGDTVVTAVADWSSTLLTDARIVPDAAVLTLHPRTALGFDDTGAWLLLVVVDGRQPGFSEGVTLYELAGILKARGCSQAINLDGGGSSIMLVREPGDVVRTVNSPSGKEPRPVPVMLGVRLRAAAGR